ncbi:MAG TPA: Gfo/Idh/MocA family oxidoreductase [Nitrospirae bacterium]|nr:Gfo/Idh/MocA family oxidoreductase [Nitrospirota bacterium]
MLKVGVIGVGYLGRHHARVFSEIDGVELVGVVDIDRQRAEEIAERYGCLAFSNHAEMLDRVDAVSIVTPTTTHYPIAMECLEKGRDIFVEKPFTVTIEEADRIIEKARKMGRILQVGHIERFNPAVTAIEGLIESPRFIESERVSPFLGRATDVDVTLDLMIHDIDIILSLTKKKVSHIHAVGAKVLTDRLDVAKAWIEFEDGISALITAGRLATEKRRFLKIYQDSGLTIVDYQKGEIVQHFRKGGEITRSVISPAHTEPLKAELQDFLRSVLNRTEPTVTGEDGREALKIALEISEKILR